MTLKEIIKIRLLIGLIVYSLLMLWFALAASGTSDTLNVEPSQPTAEARPSAIPSWKASYAEKFPGCEKQVEGKAYPRVLVVVLDGSLRRMDTDAAWARSHDDNAGNDVWVVGGCR